MKLTKNEIKLLENLIKYYEENIVEASKFKLTGPLLKFLSKKSLQYGVCWAADEIFATVILYYDQSTIQIIAHIILNHSYIYWFATPTMLFLDIKDTETIIESLHQRVDLMKKILTYNQNQEK